jgi:predicted nucleic acid-binding protein
MVYDRIVIDTGPLILMAKINALSIMAKLPYQFVAPQKVIDELNSGVALGYQTVDAPMLQVLKVAFTASNVNWSNLGAGEREVIQLANEQGIKNVCLDDLRARHLAKSLGLSVVGLLGLFGRAKMLGIIPFLRPYAEQLLIAGAHYSPELVNKVIGDIDGSITN